jgi:hypothetical protein
VDSLLGAQVAVNPTPKLSAVLQVVMEENGYNSYQPHVEWANVKYQFSPEFSVRVGRTVLPFLMVTDFRKVGYANPWVRPPVEVYSLVPVTSIDGADTSYRMPVGTATNTLQVAAGRADSRFRAGTAKAREVVAISDTFEQGFATLRLNYGRSLISLPLFDPLFDGFRQFGPEGAAIADRYAMNRRLVTFAGASASYDPGAWFAMGEWSRISSDSVLGTKSGAYVSGGYRFGRLTPYVTYARSTANRLSDPGLALSGLPSFLVGPATDLNAGLNAILGSKAIQETVSVGARWELAKNVALKVQYDRIDIRGASPGTLVNLQPAFQPGGKVDLFSATIDFVLR